MRLEDLSEIRIIVHKDADSCYGVTVESLPGCFSAGDTLKEALANTVEAIECHMEGAEDPLGTELEKLDSHPLITLVKTLCPVIEFLMSKNNRTEEQSALLRTLAILVETCEDLAISKAAPSWGKALTIGSLDGDRPQE